MYNDIICLGFGGILYKGAMYDNIIYFPKICPFVAQILHAKSFIIEILTYEQVITISNHQHLNISPELAHYIYPAIQILELED